MFHADLKVPFDMMGHIFGFNSTEHNSIYNGYVSPILLEYGSSLTEL